MDRTRRNGAWDIVLVRPSASTARTDRCARLLLMWSAAIAVVVALYVFASYVWGSVAAAFLLVVGCGFTCYWFKAAPEPPLLPEVAALRVAMPVQVVVNGGLSQEDIEAIPAFEYHRKVGAAEQCAVCINVVRDGETVRRLPACGHVFHAPCVDAWLRAHATCPMCRADVKVSGEPPAEAAV
ncbi:hypothetical protein ACP70R_033031 [Stipagrostis hirtigluma subsp. patula]